MTEKQIKLVSALIAIIGLIGLIASGGATVANVRADIAALGRVDAGLLERDLRIENEQVRIGEVVMGNQRSLAAIEAKIDILLSDRDRRTAP